MAQGRRVGHGGVAVHALQQHGAVREEAVQLLPVGQFLLGPVVLVPAAAQDPGLLGMGPGENLYAFQYLLPARGALQVGLLLVQPVAQEVAVPVDEAGVHGAARRVVGLLGGIFIQDLPFGAEFDDAPVLDRHRLVFMPLSVERHDVRVMDHEVGVLVLVRAGGEEDGQYEPDNGLRVAGCGL